MARPDPLRVLVVTNMWPSAAAPMAGVFVAEQVASLERCGVQADVLHIDGATGGWRAYLAGFGRVRDALRRGRYDLIHAHYVFSGIMALGGAALARRRDVPVVVTQHGIETQTGWTAPLCRWTSRRAAATIATSQRAGCTWPSRCRRHPLRGGHGAVPAHAHGRGALFGLPADVPLVLFAGMRRPEKRFDLVETAVARLAEQGRPCNWSSRSTKRTSGCRST